MRISALTVVVIVSALMITTVVMVVVVLHVGIPVVVMPVIIVAVLAGIRIVPAPVAVSASIATPVTVIISPHHTSGEKQGKTQDQQAKRFHISNLRLPRMTEMG
jgi:hypothetical protein